MGRFSIEFEVANYGDIALTHRGLLKRNQVRRQKIEGVVDCSASRFVLPLKVAKELGLRIAGKARVKYADGRRAIRTAAQGVYVKILGRDSTYGSHRAKTGHGPNRSYCPRRP